MRHYSDLTHEEKKQLLNDGISKHIQYDDIVAEYDDLVAKNNTIQQMNNPNMKDMGWYRTYSD